MEPHEKTREKPIASKQPKKETQKYRVFVSQVNQTFVTVEASSEDEAREKGYAKWRRDDAHSHVIAVEEVKEKE